MTVVKQSETAHARLAKLAVRARFRASAAHGPLLVERSIAHFPSFRPVAVCVCRQTGDEYRGGRLARQR